jgi:hypothetical protein
MRGIAGTEKSLRAAEQTGVVLMPSDPSPVRNAASTLERSRAAAAAISNIAGKKAGPFSSARTSACSGEIENRSVAESKLI